MASATSRPTPAATSHPASTAGQNSLAVLGEVLTAIASGRQDAH
ncbi:hypothetical protein [Gandjariella thermophila]|nr:hypothetical protein [Gandjariella thermophila]